MIRQIYLLALALIVLSPLCTPSLCQQGKTTDLFVPNPIPQDQDKIVCTFERTISVAYENNQIVHGTPHKESTPMVDVFLGLTTDQPKLTGFGLIKSYESDLDVILRKPEKIVLMGLPKDGSGKEK